jgi:hypothetical protein
MIPTARRFDLSRHGGRGAAIHAFRLSPYRQAWMAACARYSHHALAATSAILTIVNAIARYPHAFLTDIG